MSKLNSSNNTPVHTVPVRVARIGRTYRGVPIERVIRLPGLKTTLNHSWTKRELRDYEASEDSSGN